MMRVACLLVMSLLSSACTVKGEFPTLGNGTSIRLSHNLSQRDIAQLPTGSYPFVPDDRESALVGVTIGLVGWLAAVGHIAGIVKDADKNRIQDLDAGLAPLVPVLLAKMKAVVGQSPSLNGTEVLFGGGEVHVAANLSLYFIRNVDGTASPALSLAAAYYPDGRLFSTVNPTQVQLLPAIRYYHWVSGKSEVLKPNEGWLVTGLDGLRKQIEEGADSLMPLFAEEMQNRMKIGADNKAPVMRLADRLGPASALALCVRPLRQTDSTMIVMQGGGYYCKETTGLMVLPKGRFLDEKAAQDSKQMLRRPTSNYF